MTDIYNRKKYGRKNSVYNISEDNKKCTLPGGKERRHIYV